MMSRSKRLVEMALKQHEKEKTEEKTSVDEDLPIPSTSRVLPLPCSRESSPIPSFGSDLENAFSSDDSVFDKDYQPPSDNLSDLETSATENINELPQEIISNKETTSPSKQATPKKRKVSDPTLWKRSVEKANRLKGKSYKTTTGKNIPARPIIAPRCLNLPKHKCKDLIPEDGRLQIYKTFHGLDTLYQQREFIVKHVTVNLPKRKTTNHESRRKATKSYSLTYKGEKHNVCRNYFLDTLNIPEATIRGALAKVSETGQMLPDMRGKKAPPQKTDENSEKFFRHHILSFPSVEFHYCRKKSEYKYLDSSLTIKTMYKLYKLECEKISSKPVCFEKYRRVFREYKLTFHKPKKDFCKTCEVHKNTEGNDDQNNSHGDYLKRKEAARQCRDEDKETARRQRLFWRLTLTYSQFLTLLRVQPGLCFMSENLQFTILRHIT
ncbi:uncharacterized protein LOC130451562 [Diorhabda sublineata]|uniref:uncharacterized protein LOC130451562 n=1 Tax=Diorhabda sublineata TaxID=1163346 RepID=UPI0024E0D48E|nr:uncharacterized protein LOC130451562 [Diorhabda sublineata]